MQDTISAQLVKPIPTIHPAWIIFKAGRDCEARLPVEDAPCDLWTYVLDVTSLGFRADRVGDTIVITGRPSTMEVALS